ncbi:bifunctional oligoribonuclease/PAP phosphatase NrnA [Geobacter sp. AOG1]|uniref:DHH family phosphoesterase n=1 Tax=Geobacter sp. AOG1 TaxID=1566346 RepID=UPI001CC7A67D|nr:bifunctional oligoribonuclease/PAP phosphatase NrnA [Geobacter sp. AOG1]GFE58932.1 phosphoesterase [Geobacter sp. AOG1]
MIEQIIAEIAAGSNFLVTTHESPDGDAVGSSLALANYLRRLGKDVTVHYCDPVPDIYRFLPLADTVLSSIPDRDFDVCFVLDVGEFRRAGKELAGFKRISKFINIDHHLNCEEFGALNLIDSQACATGALIYRIMKAAGHEVDYDTALCIYTAIITDTGSFRYSNSNPEAFAISGEMIARGVNAWFIAEQLYESQPRQRLELLALSLATLEVSPRGDLAAIAVTLDMYEKTGTNAELTDGFVNYPRSIRGVEVAVFFREINPGFYKVGFRSKGKVDVSSLAANFGGGGHHNAAGCNMAGTLDEVKQTVFARLQHVM